MQRIKYFTKQYQYSLKVYQIQVECGRYDNNTYLLNFT